MKLFSPPAVRGKINSLIICVAALVFLLVVSVIINIAQGIDFYRMTAKENEVSIENEKLKNENFDIKFDIKKVKFPEATEEEKKFNEELEKDMPQDIQDLQYTWGYFIKRIRDINMNPQATQYAKDQEYKSYCQARDEFIGAYCDWLHKKELKMKREKK